MGKREKVDTKIEKKNLKRKGINYVSFCNQLAFPHRYSLVSNSKGGKEFEAGIICFPGMRRWTLELWAIRIARNWGEHSIKEDATEGKASKLCTNSP